MRWRDAIGLVAGAIRGERLRAGLTVLGIAVGIAAVVLLTAIGTGVQRYVVAEFTQFGTHLLAVTPGRTGTFGAGPGMFGSDRPLTLADAEALRLLPGIEAMVPVVQGNARIEAATRARRSVVLGVGPDAPRVWRFGVATGRFLPPDDPQAARPFAVLGAALRAALFPDASPLGALIRIGDTRFRVIGVMERKGQVLGFDIDDAIYIPAARALEIFDREGVMEIDLLYRPTLAVETVERSVSGVLQRRHGRLDFTVTSQAQMLDVLGGILGVLTGAVAALGAISLLVGAVGIVTIMTIAVTERTAEVGLLRALGATRRQIQGLFLLEAVALALLGGVAGLLLGGVAAWLLAEALPALPVAIAVDYALMALGLAALVGLLAGVLPARHAATLDPVQALRAE